MNVGEICSRRLVSVHASAPLSEAAQLMHDCHVGAVVVIKEPADSPVAVGMITDRDLVRAQLERTADLSRLSAESVMSRDPLLIAESEAVEDAILKLRRKGVRRAPVVDSHGLLVGLVSTDDLTAHVARQLTSITSVLQQQPWLEGGDSVPGHRHWRD